jgi:hypothetical protein
MDEQVANQPRRSNFNTISVRSCVKLTRRAPVICAYDHQKNERQPQELNTRDVITEIALKKRVSCKNSPNFCTIFWINIDRASQRKVQKDQI